MPRSSGRKTLIYPPTLPISVIVARISEKLVQTASMARHLQQSLDCSAIEKDGTDFVINVQNLDRIEQTLSDCANLLRYIASRTDAAVVEPTEVIGQIHLQEIRDLLCDKTPAYRVPSGTIQWL